MQEEIISSHIYNAMESKEEMTGHESLELIQQMIRNAKEQFSDESFYYLLWGWLVFIASLSHYVLDMIGIEEAPMVWLLMPLGGVATFIYSIKAKRNEKVKTYIDEFSKYALIAFLVCLMMVLFNQQRLGMSCYPMIMMVYGMWLFISGGTLRFKPLIIGGIANWIIAIPTFYVDFRTQLLLLALAVLIGYIIPGHMLSNRYRKQQ